MKKMLSPVLALLMILTLMPALSVAEGYTEAPMLAAKVEAGELPSLNERLPDNPLVVECSEEIGKYGGTWRQAVPIGTRSHAMGHLGMPIGESMIMYGQDNSTIVANIAESFEVSEDWTTFTFKLRKGMKWSDGTPVSMADVEFWWNDVLHNLDITPSAPDWEGCSLVVVDEYTFQLVFDTPKPLQLARFAYARNSGFVLPSHYLKQYHKEYLSEDELAAVMDEFGFDDWVSLFGDRNGWETNKDRPNLSPFILTSDPAVTNTLTFERNPYYWCVDEEGKQLPYLDTAVIDIVESTDLVNMKAIAGELDVQLACVQESFSNYPLFAQYAQSGDYHIDVSEFDEPNAMNIHFNTTTVDPVKAPYLTSVDFRRAMSLGFDRDSIISTFYTIGTYSSEKAQTSPIKNSQYYSEEMATQYTDFDPVKANEMLDGLGMTTYDAQGYRMTANGEPFSLVITCPNYDSQWIEVMEMIASQWRENLKINITANEVEPSLWDTRMQANDYDVTNCTGHSGFSYLSTTSLDCWTGFPGTQWNRFYMIGSYPYLRDEVDDEKNLENAVKPTPEVERMWEIGKAVTMETDIEKRDELIRESLQIQTDNLYVLGIGRRLPAIIIVKNNMRNVTGLNQDWAYGFAATSRPDTYWKDAQ